MMNNDIKTTVASAVTAMCIVGGYFFGKQVPPEVQAAIVTLAGCAIMALGYFTNKNDR
jgi:hypothetical protein